jgi:DNA-binding NarL/FixJ family response regulator
LRIVIAEDNLLMREGIASVLALDDDLALVASCGDYDKLLAAVEGHQPDVVITDIRMPPAQTDEGIRAANIIRADHPGIGVVVLSQYVEPRYALKLLEAGSGGRVYLLKERVAIPAELATAVRRVADGGTVIDPKVVDALIDGGSQDKASILNRLTERERKVLAEMATVAVDNLNRRQRPAP